MYEFLRLRKVTSPEVPPSGFVDLVYDANTGFVSVRDADGVLVDNQTAGLLPSTGGNGSEDAGKLAQFDQAGGFTAEYISTTGSGNGFVTLNNGGTSGGQIIVGGAGGDDLTVSGEDLGGIHVQKWANASGTLALTTRTDGRPDTFIPPTSNPHIAGAVWNNAGTLAVSAG